MLDTNLLLVIGFIAVLLAQVIKFAFARLGKPIHRGWITVVTYGVSFVVAVLWNMPSLPAMPSMVGDPSIIVNAMIVYLGELLAITSGIVGFATLIYNVLLEKIFDKLGFVPDEQPPL